MILAEHERNYSYNNSELDKKNRHPQQRTRKKTRSKKLGVNEQPGLHKILNAL